MTKPIKVKVLADDIRSTHYQSRDDCALARAIKRDYSFSVDSIHVGGQIVDINNKKYEIKLSDAAKLQSMYEHYVCSAIPKRRILEPTDFFVTLIPMQG